MRNLLIAIVLLFTVSSFTGDGTTGTSNTTSFKRIVYSGCFDDGTILVTVSYLPNLQTITDVTVSTLNTGYAVTSYTPNSTITNVGSTLYANNFTVYFTIPGVGTSSASWSGQLYEDCSLLD